MLRIGKDCREWLEQQEKEFMQPEWERFGPTEAKEYTGDKKARAGWYCRLSAPGYLDCTEWEGPYRSQSAAVLALYLMYGD